MANLINIGALIVNLDRVAYIQRTTRVEILPDADEPEMMIGVFFEANHSYGDEDFAPGLIFVGEEAERFENAVMRQTGVW